MEQLISIGKGQKLEMARVIQEQLHQKICECEGLQETVASLRQQLSDASQLRDSNMTIGDSQNDVGSANVDMELHLKELAVPRNIAEKSLTQAQASEIEELQRKVNDLTEAKSQLEARNHKLAEESSYAKGLASAAAVELKALSEEVAKLMNENERLTAESAAHKYSPQKKASSGSKYGRRGDGHFKKHDQGGSIADMKRELAMSHERELSYEAAMLEKEQREAELQKKVEESKQREAYLENELANMWVLVAKLKKSHGADHDDSELRTGVQRVDDFEISRAFGER
ncbi:hypothetical protein ACLOJK_006603 [Asimina triloba]